MKKLLLSISIAFASGMVFGQFGGGTGTESDPFILSSIDHLEELSDSVISGNPMTGVHFSLISNIEDSIRLPIGISGSEINARMFDGIFHGHNNSLITAIDLRESVINYGYNSLFPLLGPNGILDSLTITGYIFACNGIVGDNYGRISFVTNNLSFPFTQIEFSQYVEEMDGNVIGAGICSSNFGIISNCTNNAEIHGTLIGGICTNNLASVLNCTNSGFVIFHNESYAARGGGITGINHYSSTIVTNCLNLISFTFTGNYYSDDIGGITGSNSGEISFCQNYGNIFGKIDYLGGIAGSSTEGQLLNCSNYGNIQGNSIIGGIIGYSESSNAKNCFNSGTVNGDVLVGAIRGYSGIEDSTINCLNISKSDGSAIVDTLVSYITQLAISHNNYYDKQMCLSKGIDGEDVQGSAEGKLTTQLTGTSPELQAMLGNGWSYAEGRYPIPLGLENDSMALVAATPVYLHFETEEDYNHVDSVSKNFTVTTEVSTSSTTVEFNWDEANGRVSFSDENVTLLSLGIENLTVSLGDYSKKVRVNIVDTETYTPTQTIENQISVYPNPANDYININLNGIKANKLEIYDITGKLLIEQTLLTENPTLNIEILGSGVYFIIVWDELKNVGKLNFVKR